MLIYRGSSAVAYAACQTCQEPKSRQLLLDSLPHRSAPSLERLLSSAGQTPPQLHRRWRIAVFEPENSASSSSPWLMAERTSAKNVHLADGVRERYSTHACSRETLRKARILLGQSQLPLILEEHGRQPSAFFSIILESLV